MYSVQIKNIEKEIVSCSATEPLYLSEHKLYIPARIRQSFAFRTLFSRYCFREKKLSESGAFSSSSQLGNEEYLHSSGPESTHFPFPVSFCATVLPSESLQDRFLYVRINNFQLQSLSFLRYNWLFKLDF